MLINNEDDPAWALPQFYGLPRYYRHPLTLEKIEDVEVANRKGCQRCDTLEINLQIEFCNQRIELIKSKQKTLIDKDRGLQSDDYLSITKELERLDDKLMYELLFYNKLSEVSERHAPSKPDNDQLQNKSLDQVTQLENTDLDPINKYYARGTAGSHNQYYRYTCRYNGKIKHTHVPGGAVGNSLVEGRVKEIQKLLALGANHDEILNFIANWQGDRSKRAA